MVLASRARDHLHHLGLYHGCLTMSHRFIISSLHSTTHPTLGAVVGGGRLTLNGSGICLSMNPSTSCRKTPNILLSPTTKNYLALNSAEVEKLCTRIRSLTDT